MMASYSLLSPWEVESDVLIIPFPSKEANSEFISQLNQALNGAITRLQEQGELTGKSGESTVIYPAIANNTTIKCKKLILLGCGELQKLGACEVESLIAPLFRKLCEKQNLKVCVELSTICQGNLKPATVASLIVSHACVAGADQGFYLTERKRNPFCELILTCAGQNSEEMKQAIMQGEVLGQGINLTRELVNRGPHDIYPETFAKKAEQVAQELNLRCEIWDKNKLTSEKMGSMLGVAQGSSKPPFMVMVEYMGNPDSKEIIALVGKGVTFDSGGLCLKQPDGMKTMKCDMAGAATVLGAMSVIGKLKPKVNVRGYLGLVENMISGEAYRLGDVLTAKNGVTIEVMNTDAEGRLVLADVLCVAVEQGATSIIDLATLTGACVIALGDDVTGVFTNNQGLCDKVLAASKLAGEDSWQLPMHESFNEQLKSDVANCKNVGTRSGGAITAAKFLEKFVNNVPWVHLDIAGPAFASSAKGARDAGATGAMVKTLVKFVEEAGTK